MYKQAIVEGIAGELFVSEICQHFDPPLSLSTVRSWRLQDKEFDEACSDAESSVTDTLERSAIRRARDGVLEPVVSGGKLVMDPEDPGRPLMQRRYSDSLLWNLLRSRRREVYGDKQQIDANVQFDSTGAKDSIKAKFAAAVATSAAVEKQE
jgi:hypothetical protein